VAELLAHAAGQNVTLVYSAHDKPGNSAQVLLAYLQARLAGR